jgi:hypothetical protein
LRGSPPLVSVLGGWTDGRSVGFKVLKQPVIRRSNNALTIVMSQLQCRRKGEDGGVRIGKEDRCIFSKVLSLHSREVTRKFFNQDSQCLGRNRNSERPEYRSQLQLAGSVTLQGGRAMAQGVSSGPPNEEARVRAWVRYVRFVVNKVALRQGFRRDFRFSLSISSFHQGSILIYHHLGKGSRSVGGRSSET